MCLGGVLLFTAVVGSLVYLAGWAPGRIFQYLGLAAVCIALASLAWEVVERRTTREDAAPGPAAWLAFPAAVCLGLASLPLLVLVFYPAAEEYFTTSGRVTATISERATGSSLDLHFPEPTTERGENLRINARVLPDGYIRNHPEIFVWHSPRTLCFQIAPLLHDLGLERIETVGINLLHGVPRFTFQSGKTVPRQSVRVR